MQNLVTYFHKLWGRVGGVRVVETAHPDLEMRKGQLLFSVLVYNLWRLSGAGCSLHDHAAEGYNFIENS